MRSVLNPQPGEICKLRRKLMAQVGVVYRSSFLKAYNIYITVSHYKLNVCTCVSIRLREMLRKTTFGPSREEG